MSVREMMWVEKYRPQNIGSLVLPDSVLVMLRGIVNDPKNMPHLMFYGSPGTGKTSAARALCNELDADVLFINASSDRGIDTIKTNVDQFTNTVSWNSYSPKIVILDEADNLTNQAMMALRGFLEMKHQNARFIFTLNYAKKVPDPIQSRLLCVNFDENINSKDLKSAFVKRLAQIQKDENPDNPMTRDDALYLIEHVYPDLRKAIMFMQKSFISQTSLKDVIHSGDRVDGLVDELMTYGFSGDYKGLYKAVKAARGVNWSDVISRAADVFISRNAESQHINKVLELTHKMMYEISFVADPKLSVLLYFSAFSGLEK